MVPQLPELSLPEWQLGQPTVPSLELPEPGLQGSQLVGLTVRLWEQPEPGLAESQLAVPTARPSELPGPGLRERQPSMVGEPIELAQPAEQSIPSTSKGVFDALKRSSASAIARGDGF
jgi:hypothetical protein